MGLKIKERKNWDNKKIRKRFLCASGPSELQKLTPPELGYNLSEINLEQLIIFSFFNLWCHGVFITVLESIQQNATTKQQWQDSCELKKDYDFKTKTAGELMVFKIITYKANTKLQDRLLDQTETTVKLALHRMKQNNYDKTHWNDFLTGIEKKKEKTISRLGNEIQ